MGHVGQGGQVSQMGQVSQVRSPWTPWTNTFCSLDKYIVQFEQLKIAVGTNQLKYWGKYIWQVIQIHLQLLKVFLPIVVVVSWVESPLIYLLLFEDR